MFQTFWAIFSPDNCGKVSVYLVEKFDHRYMPTNGSCEQLELIVGSGWSSVSRAVASNTSGPLFESSHWQNLHWRLLTVNCIEKTKIRRKEAGNGPFLNFCSFRKLFGFGEIINQKLFLFTFKIKGPSPASFSIIFVFSNKHYNFYS